MKPEPPPAAGRIRDWTWAGLAVLVLLGVSGAHFLRLAESAKAPGWNDSRLTYVPSGKLLKPLVLDLDEAVAAALWIRGMLYFSDAYLQGKSYPWLGHILDVVTTLNPRFRPAYEFGGVVLTKEKRELPKTVKLLERGVSEFPKDWRLRLYAAMARLDLDSNHLAAAKYLEPITLDKEVPDHIRTLCASLLNKGGGRKVAVAFLVERYLHSDNSINREIFVDKILKLYPESGGDPAGARERAVYVRKILHEAGFMPVAERIALVVIDEYLSGSLSPQSRGLMKALGYRGP